MFRNCSVHANGAGYCEPNNRFRSDGESTGGNMNRLGTCLNASYFICMGRDLKGSAFVRKVSGCIVVFVIRFLLLICSTQEFFFYVTTFSLFNDIEM